MKNISMAKIALVVLCCVILALPAAAQQSSPQPVPVAVPLVQVANAQTGTDMAAVSQNTQDACQPIVVGESLTDAVLLPGGARRISGAQDWEILARSIAGRVHDTLAARNDLRCSSIFVKQPSNMPFEHVFHEFLRAALVSKGLQVVEHYTPASLVLEYDALLVGTPENESLSSFDMGNASSTNNRRQRQQEVLINARLVHNNHFAMHISALRIIENEAWVLYAGALDGRGALRSGRKVRVVAR